MFQTPSNNSVPPMEGSSQPQPEPSPHMDMDSNEMS